MTMAGALRTPGHPSCPHTLNTEHNTLKVNDSAATREDVPQDQPHFTAAEVLEVALAAYERGLADARAQAGRDRWNDPAIAEPFRQQRIAQEVAAMRLRAEVRYIARQMPDGYDYKGGPVDWDTSMPAGSGCAWLRHQRGTKAYGLAGAGR